MRILAAACISAFLCSTSAAQRVPVLPEGVLVVGNLARAASLRVDPAGLLYIADPGRHVIDIRLPSGEPVHVLGGPGAGEGQFDGPMDVDPTTGLLLVVADAGNSRLVRFRARYQLAETIPLFGSEREVLDLSVAVVDPARPGDDGMPGRPISVVLSEANETFAVDEVRGLVAKWDIGRRLVGIIGDGAAGVHLQRPIDLEIIGDQLFVADEGLGSVAVFDLFGGYVTEYGGGRLEDLRGLSSWAERLWVLDGNQVSVYPAGGGRELTVGLPAAAATTEDIAVFEGWLYVLFRDRIEKWPLEWLSDLAR
jgi:hypothetical protein